MRSYLVATVALALMGAALAECPNACSGHGLCSVAEDYCQCHQGYGAPDCSRRLCKFGLAFVDAPNGDLNYDGDRKDVVTFSTDDFSFSLWETHAAQSSAFGTIDAADAPSLTTTDSGKVRAGEGHFWKQCSGKGLCNDETGLCECFAGYEGEACQRQSCANDCSGNGKCTSMRDVAAAAGYAYGLWDADKNHMCVCDRGFSGHDCSLRLCPKGDDPLDGVGTSEIQTVTFDCANGAQAGTNYLDAYFKLNVTDYFGFTWQTDFVPVRVISASTTLAGQYTAAQAGAALESALTSLPNNVMSGASVSASASANAGVIFSITFPTVGDYDAVAVDTFHVDINGMGHADCASAAGFTTPVAVDTGGNSAHLLECSGRGLCDYESGICSCFAGHTGLDCSVQNALAA